MADGSSAQCCRGRADRAWLIDFPQAVDLVGNPHGFDLLHHASLLAEAW